MQFLFNSRGKHIANEVNGQLHATTGKNIGHFLSQYGFFIDMRGHYLGHIVMGNRLMEQLNNPYKNTNFGVYGNYGNVGNYGNPGNQGSIGMIGGYKDIEPDKL